MDATGEADVRQQVEGWRRAVAARDLDRVMSFYVPGDEFVGFDFVPPFVFSGAAAFRADWASTFALFDADPEFELRDLTVACSGELALVHGLSHFKGVTHERPIDVWTRQTNAFRKVGDRWLMIHEHVSVPIDMQSMKGVLDYKP